MSDQETHDSHESYAVMSFSHLTSNVGIPLFNSTIEHNQVIRITIHQASKYRRLHQDRIIDKELLLVADMSPSQFVEAITTPNRGVGSPITLKWLTGKGEIEECPYISKQQLLKEDFETKLKDINKSPEGIISTVKELLTKKSITKGDLKEVIEGLEKLQMDISSNLPFMAEITQELISETVKEATLEIEAAVATAINKAGIETIGGDSKKLIEYMKEKVELKDEQD